LSALSRPHLWIDKSAKTTTLLLHGTGADEHDLIPLGERLTPNNNLLSPRGLVNENGMNRFFERTPSGEFVEASVIRAASEMAEFLDAASDEYGFDAGAVFACGFSNGANTALATLIRHPGSLVAVVAFGSTKPLSEKPANLSSKRVFIANGLQDPYAPEPISEIFEQELRDAGAEVTRFTHPGGHQISAEHVDQISQLLN